MRGKRCWSVPAMVSFLFTGLIKIPVSGLNDTEYTVEQLLRNKSLAERYLGGYALVFRLTVDDYHHFCYPAEGKKV